MVCQGNHSYFLIFFILSLCCIIYKQSSDALSDIYYVQQKTASYNFFYQNKNMTFSKCINEERSSYREEINYEQQRNKVCG